MLFFFFALRIFLKDKKKSLGTTQRIRYFAFAFAFLSFIGCNGNNGDGDQILFFYVDTFNSILVTQSLVTFSLSEGQDRTCYPTKYI